MGGGGGAGGIFPSVAQKVKHSCLFQKPRGRVDKWTLGRGSWPFISETSAPKDSDTG